MKKEETIGRRLKKARLKSGITLDEVYRNLKIHPKILESLEEDRPDPGLGEIYIRGFLKKYAKFLGFDADKILSEFRRGPLFESLPQDVIRIYKEKGPPLIIKDRFKKSILPLATAMALLFTISIISYAGFRLVKEVKRFKPVLFEVFSKKAKESGAGTPLVIPKGQPLILKVETNNEVWLRVKSDGKIIFEHILPKGSIENWRAKEKLEIWVGRPEALNITLNNKSLDLSGLGRIKKLIIDHNGLTVEKK